MQPQLGRGVHGFYAAKFHFSLRRGGYTASAGRARSWWRAGSHDVLASPTIRKTRNPVLRVGRHAVCRLWPRGRKVTMLARFDLPGFRNRPKGEDEPNATHQGEAAGTKSRLSISRVTKEDRDAIMALAREVHEESVFGDLPFSEKKFKSYFDRTIKRPKTHLGLKATLNGRVVGFAYCYLAEHYVATGGLIATINVLSVKKEVRNTLVGGRAASRLLRGVMKWADASNSHSLNLHISSGLTSLNPTKLMNRFDFLSIGQNYKR